MKPAQARATRKAVTDRKTFNADERAAQREQAPVVIAGVSFTRRRKDWLVTRGMRAIMREQENSVSLTNRLRARITELQAQQLEAVVAAEADAVDAPAGAEAAADDESRLEARIVGLIAQADEATERSELMSYRLLVMLLVPPVAPDGDAEDPLGDARHGFGPEAAGYDDDIDGDEDAVMAAIGFLQPALDTEDAIDLAHELTGSVEPDPAEDPSSATGSS